GGCVSAPIGQPEARECSGNNDCNTASGEVCAENICWGDPPAGRFAAVLGPPTAAPGTAAATEVSELSFARDGGVRDIRYGAVLKLAPSVRVTGRIKAPCYPSIPNCSGSIPIAATVNWSRESGVPGGERVVTPVTATADGFDLYLPRPEQVTTYTVTVIPS